MISYSLETEINLPIDKVIQLFSNRAHLPVWQPGLVSDTLTRSEPHPTYDMVFEFGRRKMTITESIIHNTLPHRHESVYTMKGVHNRIQNSFTSLGPGKTLWVSRIDFKFKGLMKLISFFMKNNFEKQSTMIMSNFKKFAEAHG